jgi:4'-phosphopantetheinyl transferase
MKSDFEACRPTWLRADRPPAFAEGEIHLWRAALDLGVQEYLRYGKSLSHTEKERFARCLSERERLRRISARGILRCLLAGYLSTSPEAVSLTVVASGKPRLADPPAKGALHFNLSHAGGLALFVFSVQGPVGVDVERTDRTVDPLALSSRFFSEEETRFLKTLQGVERRDAFLSLWTEKEACLKALGKGIGALSTVARSKGILQVRRLLPEKGFVASVASATQGYQVRCLQWALASPSPPE